MILKSIIYAVLTIGYFLFTGFLFLAGESEDQVDIDYGQPKRVWPGWHNTWWGYWLRVVGIFIIFSLIYWLG